MDDEKILRDAAPPGGPPGLPQPDLENLLNGIEARLGKFVVEEVAKIQVPPPLPVPPLHPLPHNPRGGAWGRRQDDFGVLIGGFPIHTR
eukprot:13875905-Heterocapsa_arctica.AAC.1